MNSHRVILISSSQQCTTKPHTISNRIVDVIVNDEGIFQCQIVISVVDNIQKFSVCIVPKEILKKFLGFGLPLVNFKLFCQVILVLLHSGLIFLQSRRSSITQPRMITATLSVNRGAITTLQILMKAVGMYSVFACSFLTFGAGTTFTFQDHLSLREICFKFHNVIIPVMTQQMRICTAFWFNTLQIPNSRFVHAMKRFANHFRVFIVPRSVLRIFVTFGTI